VYKQTLRKFRIIQPYARKPGSIPGPVHVGFVVDKVALTHVSL